MRTPGQGSPLAVPDDDPLTEAALTREIDDNRLAERRLWAYTLVSLLIVAAVITARVLWL